MASINRDLCAPKFPGRTEWEYLLYIDFNPRSTARSIAVALGRHECSGSIILRRLEHKGLVRNLADKTNNPHKFGEWELTGYGRDIVALIHKWGTRG